MSYDKGLKSLRAKMLTQATGVQVSDKRESSSFIPARVSQSAPEESTEDLLSVGASWLSDIKKAAIEYKKAYEASKPKHKADSPLAAFAQGATTVVGKAQEEEKQVDKEAFLQRRPEPRPEVGLGGRVHKPAPEGSSPGYGDIEQKTIEETIKAEAKLRNIDPLTAVAIFRAEGAGAYQSQIGRSGKGSVDGKEASYGPFQLYTGGGLGNVYEEKTGRVLTEDNTMDGLTNQIRFALDQAVNTGWTPWYGRKQAGIGKRDGLEGAKVVGNWQ